MILTNNSTYPIGLDISDLSIKLVQLDKSLDKIKIQAIGQLELQKNIVANGEIKNKTELIKAIKKIVSSPLFGKVNSEEVVACLPESKTFIKLIEVQKSPNALADIIGGEIEKHVPMAINEIYFDWQIIEELADKYFVMIGAAPQAIVNQYTEMLDEAKLSPTALEIEPVAIARCLLKEEAPNLKPINFGHKTKIESRLNYGIIDIGASHTCMIFYSGNAILFTVSMPISGGEITAKISQALDLTADQAEKAKIICGLDEKKANGVIKNILADTTKKLIEKIKESLSYYENYFYQYGPLNQILICGGGANIPELTKIIGKELSVEVKVGDALTNINEATNKLEEIFIKKYNFKDKSGEINKGSEKNLTFKQNNSTSFTTAFGLALRGVLVDEL
ncbi:MAG: pilus assembly protein PilM [bacterium]|nr:pilus assembly protein PilM [bacterium]